MTLTPAHKNHLEGSAVPGDVAEATGAFSVTERDQLPAGITWSGTGIVFLHHPLEGDPVPQYRPDKPDGERKYLFPIGPVPLNIVPAMRERVGTASRVLIVEGTKQTLAAVAHAPDDTLVVGIAGCWGWSRDGVANPELGLLGIAGKPVVVALDADVATNRKVWQAGDRLREHLEVLGADSVRFLTLPASGTVGLDDYLATAPVGVRGDVFGRLIDRAGKIPRRPKAKPSADGSDRFFDKSGLLIDDLVAEIRNRGDYAATLDGGIARYRDGVYVDDNPMVSAVRELLGNRTRDAWIRNTTTLLVDELRREGLTIGDTPTDGLVNVANGMLRVGDGTLLPHDPKYLSGVQLPVRWNPTATSPRFDAWLTERVGTQADDLLEAAGLMLCAWIPQRKVLFLYGPARSGKSTLLRLLEAVAGDRVASVTLHALATNRFAAASLHGAVLNSAGDLSDRHVDDLALFKTITGDDLVAGERKFRDAFTFRNRALFAFSANNPPTVSETSRAYVERIRPFCFPWSIAGSEDQRLEAELRGELDGILVRLVHGAQRWIRRGGYAPANQAVLDDFAQQSDVAALFAAEAIEHDPGGFVSGKAAFDTYREWAVQNGRGLLGRNRFQQRLESVLGPRERATGSTSGALGWRDYRLVADEDWSPTEGVARIARFVSTSPPEGIDSSSSPIPHVGEVGEKRAIRATVEPDPDPWDPDEIVTEVF